MADVTVINSRKVDLADGLLPENNLVVIAAGDEMANKFIASVYSEGTEVSLSGETCTGYFIRPDGVTVVINGTTESNRAIVVLPAECYYYAGHFVLSINVGGTTVRHIEGNVVVTSSERILDDGETYSLAELTAMINAKLPNPETEGTNGQVLTTDGRGGTYWADPNQQNIAGRVRVSGTDYTVRTGTAGASGCLTIVTG